MSKPVDKQVQIAKRRHPKTRTVPPKGWQKVFLRSLSKVPNVSLAADIAHVSMFTVYRHRHVYPRFAEQWTDAITRGNEKLERHMWNRATDGSPDWTWVKDARGRLVKKPLPNKCSDTLAIFLAKGAMPEKYRERVQNEVVGPEGGPVQHEFAIKVTAEELP